ncbi:MAG: hypothetical protein MUP28_09325 [Candidatus Aminicenantes bacterium]|nr:hypothetical protein [Candidatus Aminicenantes bacterium]
MTVKRILVDGIAFFPQSGLEKSRFDHFHNDIFGKRKEDLIFDEFHVLEAVFLEFIPDIHGEFVIPLAARDMRLFRQKSQVFFINLGVGQFFKRGFYLTLFSCAVERESFDSLIAELPKTNRRFSPLLSPFICGEECCETENKSQVKKLF